MRKHRTYVFLGLIFTCIVSAFTIVYLRVFYTSFIVPLILTSLISVNLYLYEKAGPDKVERSNKVNSSEMYIFVKYFILNSVSLIILVLIFLFVLLLIMVSVIMLNAASVELSKTNVTYPIFNAVGFLSTSFFFVVFGYLLSDNGIYIGDGAVELCYPDGGNRYIEMEDVNEIDINEGLITDKMVVKGEDFEHCLYTEESELVQKKLMAHNI